jgi:hypothetical protein
MKKIKSCKFCRVSVFGFSGHTFSDKKKRRTRHYFGRHSEQRDEPFYIVFEPLPTTKKGEVCTPPFLEIAAIINC